MQTDLNTQQAASINSAAAIAMAGSITEAPDQAPGDAQDSELVYTTELPVPEVLVTAPQLPWELHLYTKNCFNCNGFNPDGERNWERQKCRTQTHCPVGSLKVSIVGMRQRLLKHLISARDSGDPRLFMEASAVLNEHLTAGKIDEETLRWILTEAGMVSAAVPASVPSEPNADESSAETGEMADAFSPEENVASAPALGADGFPSLS